MLGRVASRLPALLVRTREQAPVCGSVIRAAALIFRGLPELAKRYADVGVDRLVLVPPAMTAEATDAVIDRAATELIPTSS